MRIDSYWCGLRSGLAAPSTLTRQRRPPISTLKGKALEAPPPTGTIVAGSAEPKATLSAERTDSRCSADRVSMAPNPMIEGHRAALVVEWKVLPGIRADAQDVAVRILDDHFVGPGIVGGRRFDMCARRHELLVERPDILGADPD